MTILILGLLLFAAVHFIPSLAPTLKASLQRRFTENGYKGIFSLLLLASFGLLIFGWRSTPPAFVYAPPAELRLPALALMAFAFFLLAISNRPSRLRSFIRHPQLTGLGLWGCSHLLLNGDSRSIILFAGLTLWAALEIWAINRRDGAWVKAAPPPASADAINVLIAAVTIAAVVLVHPWLAGVPVI